MKSRKLVAMFGVLLLITACGKEEKVEKVVRPVKVFEVGKTSQDESISFSGIVVPNKETILGFKVAGSIENINLTQGQRVKKDEVLAEIDNRDYKSNLEVYRKKYDSAKAMADNALFQYNRAEKLYRADAMTKKNFDMATAQKKAAISLLKEAQEGVNIANNKLKDTYLKAPYDGYISKIFVDNGSVVNGGTPIVTIIGEGVPEVNISVAGKDIPILEGGKDFFFLPNDSVDKKYPLALKEIGQNPEFSKITYPAVFKLKEGESIRVGTSGKVVVQLEKRGDEKVVIPVTALFEDGGSKVFIYDNGVVKGREVKLGNLYPDGEIEIVEGLKSGDKVITGGVHSIVEGEEVKLLPEPSETNVGNVL